MMNASELLKLLNQVDLGPVFRGEKTLDQVLVTNKPAPVAHVASAAPVAAKLTPGVKAASTRDAVRAYKDLTSQGKKAYVRLERTDRGIRVPSSMLQYGKNYLVVGAKGIHICNVDSNTTDGYAVIPSTVTEKFTSKLFDVRVEDNKIVVKPVA